MSEEANDTQDIVERLRVYYRSTTVNEAADEIERLREQLRLANIDCCNTTAEVERLTAERDDARWRLCKVLGDNHGIWGDDVAKELGWNYLAEKK